LNKIFLQAADSYEDYVPFIPRHIDITLTKKHIAILNQQNVYQIY